MGLSNQNPIIYQRNHRLPRLSSPSAALDDESSIEPINQQEVFDHIRDILDPEHPYSLEELNVVTEDAIEVDNERSHVRVTFTPTVPHCSLAGIIALMLRVKLERGLPRRYMVEIVVTPGTHDHAAVITKRANDKDRVAAAMENPEIVSLVDRCLAPSYNNL